jgi:hypothetical protein
MLEQLIVISRADLHHKHSTWACENSGVAFPRGRSGPRSRATTASSPSFARATGRRSSPSRTPPPDRHRAPGTSNRSSITSWNSPI